MTLGVAVGKRVNELLNNNDISQYRLAKNTCLDYKTINAMVNEKSNDINISTIYLIASEFKMTLEQFFASPIFDNINIDI